MTLTGHLTSAEVVYLAALGASAAAAPPGADRRRGRTAVVVAARARRRRGVPWFTLADAVGVSPATLRRWRDRDGGTEAAAPTAGPPAGPRSPAPPPG